MSTVQTYMVSGMSCGHCVTAVSEELRTLTGVTDVHVELVAGGDSRVQVTSEADLPLSEVREAVDEAGYTLSGSSS